MLERMQLNRTQLKFFAALIMVVDHVGAVIFPKVVLLRIIGRMSFPIFAFLLAQGFAHTRNMGKYMLRLLAAGILSQPVFSLCFYGTVAAPHLNVMFTFFLAGAAICAHRKLPEPFREAAPVVAVLMAVLAMYLRTDYGAYGVMLVFLFYLLRGVKGTMLALTGVFQIFLAEGIQRYSVFSLVPIFFYDFQKGKNIKYFFYVFYPLHMLIIYGVAVFLEIYRLPWS